MTFSKRSKLHSFSFFLLLLLVLGAFVVNGLLQRKATHAAYASSPLTVYVGSQDRSVYALTAHNGQLRWGSKTRGTVFSSPAVVGNTVYIGSEDHNVYEFNAKTGARLWSFMTGNVVDSTPAVVQSQGL